MKARLRGASASLALLAVLVLALTGSAGGAGGKPYEVWAVDQSNTNGTTSGGALYMYDGGSLARRGAAAVAERIDLGGAATQLCLEQTGTAPVRPHMVLFNERGSHALLSFVASGHVLFLDARTRTPVACIDVGAQAHAAALAGRVVRDRDQSEREAAPAHRDGLRDWDVHARAGRDARPGQRHDPERGAPAGSCAAA